MTDASVFGIASGVLFVVYFGVLWWANHLTYQDMESR